MNTIEDIQLLCRLCGSKTTQQDRLNIFDNIGMALKIRTKMSHCLGIDVAENDKLPKSVCTECINNLESFNRFKIQSHRTNNMLNGLLNRQMSFQNGMNNIQNPELEEDNNSSLGQYVLCVPEFEFTDNNHGSNSNKKPLNRKIALSDNSAEKKVEQNTNGTCKVTLDNSLFRKKRSYHWKINKPRLSRTCGFCNKVFLSKANLVIHICRHIGLKKHSCSQCSKKFVCINSLKQHIRYHEKNFSYICNYCGKGYISRSPLENHVRRHHTKELPFQCSKCNRKFSDKCSLKLHEVVHIETLNFICEICNQAFKCKTYLQNHKRAKHRPEGERKKYTCNICNKSFGKKPSLVCHIYCHTGEAPFGCDMCSKRFRNKGGLRNHMYTHTDKKRFTCDFCGNSFTLKATLEIHRLIHLGIRKFVCKGCGKTYTQNSSLYRHRKSGCPGKKD